jgi:hypothetical protein
MAALMFLTPYSAMSQSARTTTNLDDLREKIRKLEAMDLSRMAPSTLEIYKRALLRLYERALTPMQQQIDVLAVIESSSDANNSEAADARVKLADERKQFIDRISILQTSLGLTEDRSAEGAGADAESSASSRVPISSSSAPATVAPLLTVTMPAPATAEVPANPPQNPVSCTLPEGFSPVTLDAVRRMSANILRAPGTLEEKAQEISFDNYKLVFYSIAETQNIQVPMPLPNATQPKTISLDELEPYKYLGETLRTDKQMGASASAASVSGIDKPGFDWLLGLAVENGQVEKSVRDSVLTLSTSPAALFSLGRGNSGNSYQEAGILNRFGISASFNVANQDQILGNARRNQLREYSIKYRFAGDRNPRSKALEELWDGKNGQGGIASDIQRRLVALNSAAIFISRDPVLGPLAKQTNTALQAKAVVVMSSDAFKANLDPNTGKFPDDAKFDAGVCQLSNAILGYLKSDVKSQQDKLSPAALTQFKEILVPNLIAAQLNLQVVRKAFNEKVDEFFKKPIGTIAYINHREPVMGNYSEFKMLYEQNTPILQPLPLKTFVANAGFSFYHQPNPLLRQERMRAFNAAVSLEGSAASPFTETLDLSRISYSLVANYERMFENSRVSGQKADIASLQFLMRFPLFRGFGVPLSVTYSNATELDRRSGWRANFGLRMDTDKLLELMRASSPH